MCTKNISIKILTWSVWAGRGNEEGKLLCNEGKSGSYKVTKLDQISHRGLRPAFYPGFWRVGRDDGNP